MPTLTLTPGSPGALNLQAPYGITSLSIFNVKDYRAAGDGVTDDTAEVQAAITAAQAAGGGIVYFPAGTYLISQAATWDFGALGFGVKGYGLQLASTGNVRFVGAGRGATILKKSVAGGAADFNMFMTLASSGFSTGYFSFEHLTLDGGQSATTTPFTSGDEHLVMIYGGAHLMMRDCIVKNARGGGMYLYGCSYVRISDSEFTLLDRQGTNNAITLIGSLEGAEPYPGAVSVDGCVFRDNAQIDIAVGGFGGSTIYRGVSVTGCQFLRPTVTTGCGIEVVATFDCGPIAVEGCQFYGGAGASIQGTDIAFTDCSFRTMNRATPNGFAIQCNATGTTSRVRLTSVSVDTTTDDAIQIGGVDPSFIYLSGVQVRNAGGNGIIQTGSGTLRQALFVGCHVDRAGKNGIYIDSSNVDLIGCRATNCSTLTGNTYDGLVITANGDRTKVIGGYYGKYDGVVSTRYGINNAGSQTDILGVTLWGHTAGFLATANPATYLAYTQTQNTGMVALSSVFTLTDAATVAVDASASNTFKVTLAGNRTLGAATGMVVGQRVTFIVIQDGTGGRTLNVAANYPKLTWSDTGNTASKRSVISAIWDGTNWNQDGAQTPYT